MDSKQNGKVVTPADAAAFFLRQEDTAAEARDRMIQRMGLQQESQTSEAARRAMIERQTRRE